jgi:glycine/D-amino acid oxidase-like deaminating enzyme
LHALDEYDLIIATMGAACSQFPEFQHLRIHPLKGQLIEMEWPSIPPLPISLISSAYLCMNREKTRVIIGATYEHNYRNPLPDPDLAIRELYPKAIALYPALENGKIVDVKAGLRASLPSRTPFAGHIGDKIFALTGLGSRGLLYHAFFAKRLVKQMPH